jgi:hypothetical protein
MGLTLDAVSNHHTTWCNNPENHEFLKEGKTPIIYFIITVSSNTLISAFTIWQLLLAWYREHVMEKYFISGTTNFLEMYTTKDSVLLEINIKMFFT